MKQNITKTFLLLTFVFLLVSLTAVNASDNNANETHELSENYENSQLYLSNHTIANEHTIKSVNNNNKLIKQEINKKQNNVNTKNQEKTETTLSIKFTNITDDLSTENYLFTHMDEEYSIDISLTEDLEEKPIPGKIKLYLLDNPDAEEIDLNNSGHIQKTYTVDKIGTYLPIYAEYEGSTEYNSQTSPIIFMDSEAYETELTLNKIDNVAFNSTIKIEGNLTYKENIPIKDANLIISLNDKQIASATTDNQGHYSINYKLQDIPIQEKAILKVEYISPLEKYSDAVVDNKIDVEKILRNITLNNFDTIIFKTPTTFMGQVIDENNKTYTGVMKVLIKDSINNDTYYINNSVTIDDGQFEFTFIPAKATDYSLSLFIEEDSYYMDSYKTIDFSVKKANLNLNVEEEYESLVQDNVSICGKLSDQNNNPISDILIEIYVDDFSLGTVTTDNNGNFNFTRYVFEEIDDDDFFTIYFKINETENYNSISEESTYYLSRRNVWINVNTNESVKINESLSLLGQVKDAYNNTIVPKGTITVLINNQEKEQIPIDSEGKFSTDININEDYIGQSKLYVITLFNPENPSVYYTDSCQLSEVVHEILKTEINITSNDSYVNDSIAIKIDLTDEHKKNLNENISVVIRDSQFNQLLNKKLQLTNGSVTTTFTPVEEGIYYIFAQYDGKENIYNTSMTEKEITVEKIPTSLTIDSLSKQVYVNDTVIISGKIIDTNNKPVVQSKITLEIFNSTNSSIITVKTDSQGNFNTTFIPRSIAENITIRLSYNSTNIFKESYCETSIQVIKHNTTIHLESLPTMIKYDEKILIKAKVVETDDNSIVNGSVNLKINNQLMEKINLKNGEFNYTYLIKESGKENLLKIEFIENDAYNPSEATHTYEVIPLKTLIIINPINDTEINSKILITGTITDENNQNLTIDLSFKINNESSEQVSARNGLFSFEYTPKNVSEYLVNVSYTGDNQHYTSSSNITKFNTFRTKLSVENITTTVDDKNKTITIFIKVNNTQNISTEDIVVKVKIGEEVYNTTITENSTINITTDELQPGEYPITLEINQTDYFEQFNQNLTTVNIEKYTPIISLKEISDQTYSVTTFLEGNLTDTYNQPLKNTTLIITIANDSYTLITDNNGKFNLSLEKFNAGNNSLEILVPETKSINSAKYNTTFLANKMKSKIILEENTRILPGDNFTIDGQLLDNNNKCIKNKSVIIQINNKEYTVKSDENGKFDLTYNNTKVGIYTVKVIFSDSNYEESIKERNLSVTKLSVRLIVENVTSTVGENMTLKAKLVDEYGNDVNGGNLVFKLNGRSLRMDDRFDTNIATVHKFKVNDGSVEYNILSDLYLRNGKNITASYSGSYRYESAKSNVAIASIKLRNANLNVTTSKTLLKQHENVTFKVHIEDNTTNISSHDLINQNASVFFKINGITLRNDDGNIIYVPVINSTAQYNYSTNILGSVDKENNLRNYTVTAVYMNPNYYPTARNTTFFNILKSDVNINISSLQLKNNLLSIKATLKDYLGYNLVGENKVCIKINGITYKENEENKYFKIKDGILDIQNIDVGKNNVKYIEIVTGERQAYNGARITSNEISIS